MSVTITNFRVKDNQVMKIRRVSKDTFTLCLVPLQSPPTLFCLVSLYPAHVPYNSPAERAFESTPLRRPVILPSPIPLTSVEYISSLLTSSLVSMPFLFPRCLLFYFQRLLVYKRRNFQRVRHYKGMTIRFVRPISFGRFLRQGSRT